MAKSNPRQVALDVLNQIFGKDAYANIALDKALERASLSEKDRALTTALVYGVTAKEKLLAWYIAPFLKKTPKPWLHMLLLLAVYQIVFMDRIPTSAAVDEAVKLAKADSQQAANFINAVLRNFMRASRGSELPDDWETRYSMPKLLIDKFVAQFGGLRTKAILESFDEPSKASIRLIDADLQIPNTEPSVLSPVGRVAAHGNFASSPEFKAGKITIQDESSQLVAPQLEIAPDDQILDACAAPGGKTAHIAQYLTTGRITALDIYDHKLALIKENAQRLRVANRIRTKKLDARQVDRTFPPETFDKILVDAPCSGLGLLRRKPDIRYHKQATDFEALQKLQLEILSSCAPSLKKNGIMVYSTCTLTDEENFDVVTTFLQAHSDFKQIALTHERADIVSKDCLFISPELYHTDGFFIAKFKKVK